jgi:hypothetical protein
MSTSMARAFVASSLWLLWASVALAQGEAAPAPTEPLQLEWQGDSSCGDAEAMRRGALDLLGSAAPRRQLTAKATVQRDGSGWQVRLETDSEGEHGTRELRGESCGAVQRAVSLMLAMILESEPPTPPAATRPDPPAPAPPPPPPPPIVDVAPEPRESPTTPRLTPRWLVGPELAGAVGATPHLGLGIGALAGVELGRFELGVAGRYWLPREELAPVTDPARPGQRIGRQDLEAYGCFAPLESSNRGFALAGCLAPGATRVSAESVRTSEGLATDSRWSPSLSGSVRLRYFPIANVFIGLTPAATWARRERFGLGVRLPGQDEEVFQPVYSTPDVFFRLAIETGLRF